MDLEKSIIKTLAYYQALGGIPLTLVEIRRYLVEKKGAKESASFLELQRMLETLIDKGFVLKKNGFYKLRGSTEEFKKRETSAKHTALKWKKFTQKGKILPYIPYVRMISVTGSLATNSTHEESDIDILIQSSPRKIWTARLFVTLATQLFGSRRHGTKIKNQLCFNQYTTQDANELGPPNINAVIEDIRIPMWSQNNNSSFSRDFSLFSFRPHSSLMALKKIVEFVLDITLLGRALEYILGKIQIMKMKNNQVDYPKLLPSPTIESTNLIFYYPRVMATEKEYARILNELKYSAGVESM